MALVVTVPWDRVGLLREASSPQLPPLRLETPPGGVPHGSLTLPGLGRRSAITLYYARALRDEAHGRIDVGGIVHRPCELAVLDVLVARTGVRWAPPTGALYLRIDDVDMVGERRPQDRHPWDVPVVTVESVRQVAPVPEAPSYADAVAAILDRYGWQDLEFDLHRVRMEYPILHSLIDVTLERLPA